jgi:integrase
MARPRKEPRLRWIKERWTVVYRDPADRPRFVSTGTQDEGEAKEYLTNFIAALDAAPREKDPTVSAILDAYLDHKAPKLARGGDSHKTNANALKAGLGVLRPAQLSNKGIERYAKERTLLGRSAGTIIRELKVLRASLNWAVVEKWLGQAPTFDMPVTAPPPRRRWLTQDEAERLIAGAQSEHVRLFILLALATGARRSALQELKWGQIDFVAKRIDLGQGTPNKRRAIIPIDSTIIAALKDAAAIRTTDYVLEYRGHGGGNLKKAFARTAARANLNDVSAHTLRHTAATWMIAGGVPITEVARYLGDTTDVIDRVYGHHALDYLERAAGVLNERLKGVSNTLYPKREKA